MTDQKTDRSFDIPADYVGPELEFESGRNYKPWIFAGILLFSLSAAALVFVYYRSSEPSAEEFFNRAQTHFGERNFRSSIIELMNVIQQEPANAAARVLLGRSYLEVGQPASAEKELRRAGDLGAHPADLVTPLGRALLMQGRHERVLEVFDVDEQMSAPHRAAVLVIRGDASRGLVEYLDAEQSYREAQIHDPENVSALVGLAALALDTNKPTTAEALAGAALEAAPQDPQVLGLQGDIHFARGRFEEARQTYQELVALQPDNPFNLILLAQAQLGTNELENAIGNLDRVLELAPREPTANFLRAMAAYNSKDFPTARRRSEQALELAPDYLPSLILAGAANFAEGNYEQAYGHLAKFVARTGSSPGGLARKMLGTTLLQIDRNEDEPLYKGALAIKEKALGPDHPDLAQSLHDLAKFYDAQGRYAEAKPLYQRALAIREKTLGPEDPGAAQSLHSLLALLYADQGRYAQAAQMIFEPLVDRSPEDAELLSLISSAALRSGDLESGRRYLERLTAARPNDARPRAWLGRTNVGLGDVDRGIEELEKAVAQDPELDTAQIALVLSYLRERRFDEALEIAQRVQEIKPDSPMGATLAGMTFFGKGEVGKARVAFLEALEIDPGAMDASGNLAALETRSGNSDRAREVLKAALEHNPGHFLTLWRLATLETRLQRWEEAEAWAEMALHAKPEMLEARILLAKLHLRGGDAVQALAIAEKYVQAYSDNVELTKVVGQAYLVAGRAADAASPLQFLVEAEPDSIEAHGLLATSYRMLNDFDRYKEQLERILEIDPNHSQAKVRLAGVVARQGDVSAAARMLGELKETGFDDPSVLELEGVVALKEKRFADAVVSFGQAVERRPTTDLMLKVVVAQDGAGDAAGALDTLKTWLVQFPEDIAARKVLAERYLSASRFEEARSNYQTVLELAPEDVLARNNLAWALLRLGEPRLALHHAERALEQVPDNPTVMDTAGLVLVELGETERALGLLRKAAKREPTNSTMHYHLAGALAREGATREAQQILREILSKPTEFAERADAKSLLEQLAD